MLAVPARAITTRLRYLEPMKMSTRIKLPGVTALASAAMALICQAQQQPAFPLHPELLKIPISFSAEYDVRTPSPEKVPDDLKGSIMNLRFKLTKRGDSYKIVASTLDSTPREKFIYGFDGTFFYFYMCEPKTLRVGADPAKMGYMINGGLQYFPPLVVPALQAECGDATVEEGTGRPVFTSPEKLYHFVIGVDPASKELVSNGFTLKIPAKIEKIALYGEKFEKVNHAFCYTYETNSVLPLEQELPEDFFRVTPVDSKRIIDMDTRTEKQMYSDTKCEK